MEKKSFEGFYEHEEPEWRKWDDVEVMGTEKKEEKIKRKINWAGRRDPSNTSINFQNRQINKNKNKTRKKTTEIHKKASEVKK